MSREVARTGQALAKHAVPTLPAWLLKAAEWQIDPEKRAYRTPLQPAERQAAREAGAALAEALKPLITRTALREWLVPLSSSVVVPPDPDVFNGRVDAVMISAAGLPMAVLDHPTQAEALSRFKHWPAGAELLELLKARAHRLQALARALREIGTEQAKSPYDIPTRRAPPSEEEIAAVRAAVAQVTASVRPERDVRHGRTATAPAASPGGAGTPAGAPVPRETLVALWERQAASGDPAARRSAEVRLAALRRAGEATASAASEASAPSAEAGS